MVDGMRIAVPGLRGLGGQLRHVADNAARNISSTAGHLAALDGVGGARWATFAATRTAAAGWQEYLRGYVSRLDEAAQGLLDAANNYASADADAARRASRVRFE
jgi:hypothetical protein